MKEQNRCKTCRVMNTTTCPILEAAYKKHGWEYLEQCDMADVADKIWAAAKEAGKNAAGRSKAA